MSGTPGRPRWNLSVPPQFNRYFLTGLVALTPLVITLLVVIFVVDKTGGFLAGILRYVPGLGHLPGFLLTLLSFLLVLVGIYLIGLLTTVTLGRRLLEWSDRFLRRVPLIRGIYVSSRQFTETFLDDRRAFREVVLVDFPVEGTYAMGFLTSHRTWEGPEGEYVSVFVPTTPNPTSGWYLLVPRRRLIPLDISPEEGLKIIISGGMVAPEPDKRRFKPKSS